MAREVRDHFFRLAKQEGYLSRAAYKLIEIDDRKRILRNSNCVLDCGAAPGSWLQVAAARVGPTGRVVGIDLKPIPTNATQAVGGSPGAIGGEVRTIVGDLTVIAPGELLGDLDAFDVVLSDMAPSTTGDRTVDHYGSVRLCEAVLDRCSEVLRPGGRLVMKVLEGEAYPKLLGRVKSMFEKVKGFKPKASRGESTEIYIIAEGFKGEGAKRASTHEQAPSKPRGWGA